MKMGSNLNVETFKDIKRSFVVAQKTQQITKFLCKSLSNDERSKEREKSLFASKNLRVMKLTIV
jgi:hypothetical protein